MKKGRSTNYSSVFSVGENWKVEGLAFSLLLFLDKSGFSLGRSPRPVRLEHLKKKAPKVEVAKGADLQFCSSPRLLP